MPAYWNAVQACVWIATRDERLVARVRTTDTLFVTDEVISSGSLYEASHHVVMEATLEHKPVTLTVWEARRPLVEACAANALVMLGREEGQGELVEIPSTVWAHLEIRDDRHQGVIAASPDTFDRKAKWWDELRVLADSVKRQWSFPRQRQGSEICEFDLHPDTIADAAWAERRRRIFRNQQPRTLALDADGLPDKPEITLTEALSWCALGRALPPYLWAAEIDYAEADKHYARARASYAYALRWIRRSSAQMKSANSAGQVSEDISRDYRSAKMLGDHEQGAETSAKEKLASAASNLLLLQSTFEAARLSQRIPAHDVGFVQRRLDEVERKLLNAFRAGELECLGRRSDDSPWDVLPKDCFRVPVQLRLNHNRLEPVGGPEVSMEEHRYAMSHVVPWRQLLVNVAALRAWRSKGIAEASEGLNEDASSPSTNQRGNREYLDDEIVMEVIADVDGRRAKSTRAAIATRLDRIEGASDAAKIRRITEKVKDARERAGIKAR